MLTEKTIYNIKQKDMKKTIRIFAAAAACAAIVSACNSTPKSDVKVDVELPTQAETDSVSYLIGIQFGSFIKGYNFGKDLNFSEVKKGMMDFINAEGNMRDPEFNKQFKVDPMQMNRLFNDFLSKRNEYEAAVNKAEGEKFMQENKMKDGVVSTDSGLQYIITEAGNDVKSKDGQKVCSTSVKAARSSSSCRIHLHTAHARPETSDLTQLSYSTSSLSKSARCQQRKQPMPLKNSMSWHWK